VPRYLLLLRADPVGWASLTPEALEPIMARYTSWHHELRAEGRTVQVEEVSEASSVELTSADPDSPVRERPYGDTPDSVSGFWVISAEDRDDAVRTARGCPGLLHGGRIEVVEVVEHGA
jgi:hypothetical protein